MPPTYGDIHDPELGLWVSQVCNTGSGPVGFILDMEDTNGFLIRNTIVRVESRTTTSQPGTLPTVAKAWVLPTSSTGTDWAGHDGKIAVYVPKRAAWYFSTPAAGRTIEVADESYVFLTWSGSAWNAIAGATGPTGPAGTNYNPMGAWLVGTTYATNDLVTHGGGSYAAVAGSTGVTPGTDPTKWQTLAVKGVDGSKILTGSGTPSGGNDGDVYVRSNGDVYQKVSGSWGSVLFSLVGPTGAGSTVIFGDGATTVNADTITAGDLTVTDLGSGNASAVVSRSHWNTVTKTANYTATADDDTILVDASGGAVTITLLTAASIGGKQYKVKKIDSSANAVTVATTSSQTIDGSTTASLTTQYAQTVVQSDTANWQKIGGGGGGGTRYTATNSALAANATITVTHAADSAFVRKVWAFAAVSDPGPSLLIAMTSDSTSGYTSSASSTAGGGFEAFRAFNETGQTDEWANSGGNTGWLIIQLPSAATAATLTLLHRPDAPNTAPKDFTLQGSNDGSSWTTVLTVTGETGWTGSSPRIYSITSPGSYAYYKLNVTDNNGGGYVEVCEMDLLSAAGSYTSPLTIGNWSINSAETDRMLVRYDDGSGSNPNTKTTFKNRTGATLNITAVVEV